MLDKMDGEWIKDKRTHSMIPSTAITCSTKKNNSLKLTIVEANNQIDRLKQSIADGEQKIADMLEKRNQDQENTTVEEIASE